MSPPKRNGAAPDARVLILTPVKNAARHLDRYFTGLAKLTYPTGLLSLGLLEGDSTDGTYDLLRGWLDSLRARYARVELAQKHLRFALPAGLPRWAPAYQIPRRTILAKARNHLLFRALRDEDWVLWLDVDVVEYPADLIERLLATGHDIVHPHCVKAHGGPTFDRNAWCDRGETHMEKLRGGPDFVRLESVGGTVLLVRADAHRDGLIFPPYPYGREHQSVRRPGPWGPQIWGEIETEGFGLMAADMGYQCWGMPNLEVLHASD
jgi:peptide chain release factor subunit 1